MFEDLKGKVVVVTGGVTGIGGAASLAFHEAGAKVLAQYLGGGKELDLFTGKGIATVKLDLTKRDAPQKLVDEAVKRFGGIDVLVNNAGGMVERRTLDKFTDDLYDQVMDLNVRQVVFLCQAVLPLFRKQGRGNILNVSSISAKTGGSAGSTVYAGSKGLFRPFQNQLPRNWSAKISASTAYHPAPFILRFTTVIPTKQNARRRARPFRWRGLALPAIAPEPSCFWQATRPPAISPAR